MCVQAGLDNEEEVPRDKDRYVDTCMYMCVCVHISIYMCEKRCIDIKRYMAVFEEAGLDNEDEVRRDI